MMSLRKYSIRSEKKHSAEVKVVRNKNTFDGSRTKKMAAKITSGK